MHPERSVIRILLLSLVSLAIAPHGAVTQERAVVFNQVSVSGNEASLLLEFEEGRELSVVLEDGSVVLDGETVGSYAPGGRLESSWRALLGQAVALDGEAVPALLSSWELPAELSASSRSAGEAILESLANALEAPAAVDGVEAPEALDPVDPPEAVEPPTVEAPSVGSGGDSVLARLMRRADRLRELAVALDGLDVDNLDVRLGERLEVDAGETIDSSVLMVDGTLELDGTVDGDVVLIGSRLELGPNGRVTGTVRSSGGSISGDPDDIEGGVIELAATDDATEDVDDIADAVRDAVREATNDGVGSSFRSRGRGSAFRSFSEGLADLLQSLVSFGLLLGIGLGVLYFFPRQFEVVSRTAGSAPGRSLLVGLAGLVLAVPVFILGIVFLAVSIIGIPLLLAWIPLAPFLFAAATVFGLLAVARNLGRWVSGHSSVSFDGLDASRPAVQLGWGLVVLLGGYAVSNLFEMGGPWFSPFEVILILVGSALLAFATCVGLGAVILSRAGREPSYSDPGRREPGTDDSSGTGGPDEV